MADRFDAETTEKSSAGQAPRVIDLEAGRREFFRTSGLAAASAAIFGVAGMAGSARAQTAQPTDTQILNFALNLEYLEGEYYQRGAFGQGLDPSLTTGVGLAGEVLGGSQVPFSDPLVSAFMQEIANDELSHIKFLRSQLTSSAVARPKLNIKGAFTKAAVAAGVIAAGQTFDPYANDVNFLLGAYLLTDVGVTAYHGSAGLISSKDILTAAAGILAVEAYHAGTIHSTLYAKQLEDPSRMIFRNTRLISAKRSQLSVPPNSLPDDQGLSANESQIDGGTRTVSNLVPTDANGLAFPRTQRQVLNVVYGAPNATMGLFFPNGINPGP